ncbi:MAG: DUF3817 domain-containing protein [Bdellovibrionales bacterium]|nr:DUF3817 domain-containing protein [Bdellovibrionales bacterium]
MSKNFRLISYAEGASFLILLFIAMPMKYVGGNPLPVKYIGWIHGLLFVVYVASAAVTSDAESWSGKKLFLALIAAVLPFGPFVFNRKVH